MMFKTNKFTMDVCFYKSLAFLLNHKGKRESYNRLNSQTQWLPYFYLLPLHNQTKESSKESLSPLQVGEKKTRMTNMFGRTWLTWNNPSVSYCNIHLRHVRFINDWKNEAIFCGMGEKLQHNDHTYPFM